MPEENKQDVAFPFVKNKQIKPEMKFSLSGESVLTWESYIMKKLFIQTFYNKSMMNDRQEINRIMEKYKMIWFEKWVDRNRAKNSARHKTI